MPRCYLASMSKMPCPYCGRILYFDDARHTALHQVPECSQFAALVSQFSGSTDGMCAAMELTESTQCQ